MSALSTSAPVNPQSVPLDIADEPYTMIPCAMPGRWSAEVNTPGGKTYFVIDNQGNWSCTCEGFRFRRHCKHILATRDWRKEHPMNESASVSTDVATLPFVSPPAPLPAGGPVAQSPAALVGLVALALSKAQQQVRAVDHDARNAYHGYNYTSAESIIEAAKDPLAQNGLALLPLEETLNGHASKGEDRFELVCKFLLIHSSGGSMPLLRHWPVCPEKGRPLDKATAAASTLCLAYLLRDLLLLPRVAPEDEVAARDDRTAPAQAPAKGPPPKKEPPPIPKNGAELIERLGKMEAWAIERNPSIKVGDLISTIRACGIKAGHPSDLAQWSGKALEWATAEGRRLANQVSKQVPPPAKM